MNANVASLTARRRLATVDDAIASRNAAVIVDYLHAALNEDHAGMDAARAEAAELDAEYPDYPPLVTQLDALRTHKAAA
jgi:phage I-like protein